jgi:hypothetical protein
MRFILFLTAVAAIIVACEKEPELNIREGLTFDPDTLLLDSSLKGWELYSWNPHKNIWKYALMPGTNRIKTSNEILAADYGVLGREQLKLLLKRLPRGQEITWFDSTYAADFISDDRYKLPSLLEQYDISEFCENNGLRLYFYDFPIGE